ncbi:MAG: hypothetical protein ACOYLE_04945 [Bacteroidales bacterium]
MKYLFIIIFVFMSSLGIKAQITSEGTVSFVSSQSTYIKYKSTAGFLIGDTLFTSINNQLIPALLIKNLSSTSVVCSSISSYKFNINDKIYAKSKVQSKSQEKEKTLNRDTLPKTLDSTIFAEKEKVKVTSHKQRISGQIGVSSSSNFSNTPTSSSYIANYSLSLNINNIADSKLSFESNILYRQENGEWSNVQKNIFNGLKIYNLSLKYDINKSSFISFGRKINSNISNIGAIDGLQYEKSIKSFYIGGFLGSRPHYSDYSFNINLMQFGAYFGHNFLTSKGSMQNSISIVEQTNHSKTDRRFLYFQHSNSLVKNVHIFYSLELDLYKVINGQKQNTLSLTSNYFSLRYRPFKKLSLSGTYDSRKNVIYYETDKNYLSTLIESETRQGLSIQANYTITQKIYAGAKVGYRFQKSDPRPTKNSNVFISFKDIFKSQLSTILSITMLESNYLNGNIYNVRFSRGFKSGKIDVGVGYSFVNYKILNSELPFKQHTADINISTEIIKKLFLSLNFETNYEKPNYFHRLYLQLRKRF